MRWHLPLLLAAIGVFLASSATILAALERGSRALAILAAAGMLLTLALFGLAIWWPTRRVDWDRIRAEQRLWESGPLGRKWLRARQRLYDVWKL